MSIITRFGTYPKISHCICTNIKYSDKKNLKGIKFMLNECDKAYDCVVTYI